MNELALVGEHAVEPVAQDRVGLTAAHLHDHVGPGDRCADPGNQRGRGVRVVNAATAA